MVVVFVDYLYVSGGGGVFRCIAEIFVVGCRVAVVGIVYLHILYPVVVYTKIYIFLTDLCFYVFCDDYVLQGGVVKCVGVPYAVYSIKYCVLWCACI